MNFDEHLGLPARHPTEAEQLTEEGLEVSKTRLVETLQRAERYLQHEVYTCQQPVGVATAVCTQIRYTWYQRLKPLQVVNMGEINGAATLLCGAPVMGGPPFICAVHWLEKRKVPKEVGRRLRKEGRRQLKKQP